MTEAAEAFDHWCVIELMGHRTRYGRVREVELAGGKMLRIDIPINDAEYFTEYYGAASIYAIRPASEAVIRTEIARQRDPRPVKPLDYREREALPAPGDRRDGDDYSNTEED